MSLIYTDGSKRLCTCGHNIWDHEDAEGGTHECTHRECNCQQFKDADDAHHDIHRAEETK